ncbi:two-component system sensor histidine kinase RppB [Synechocystis sp. PCC 6714]|uniref:two-component system sensor histidine kinase RppB n=1 Tax=Synechocystis sp. (strain PCC 6714) TaxID=1147 RepID=UPI0003F9EB5F|nr:two-component system sensor histidine kinase RppB [Synechocystis sp. PCC 6714]AIE76291.1 Phosphate regulon sensor protein PhoR (SphS) [Synechocystis sp. PCC 6714]
MNTHRLFARSRLRLALWYALVMGGILGVLGLGVYRSIVQANWVALEREIESIAGTLHDSLEPMLPNNSSPTEVLQQIFPDLCLVNQPCRTNPTLIERHTIGISDRRLYYIRLFDYRGRLLVFSPNQPTNLSPQLNKETWQTIQTLNGNRYRQFTTILHSADNVNQSSWGYLQIGRNLTAFDAENRRILWVLGISLPVALGLVALSSWGLAGIAMGPIYQSYQQQQQFTANAAHELRSPLASLIATVEALLCINNDHNCETQTLLQTVERQGRRLSQLITDLLLLSRLEQETEPNDWTFCCLNDLVSDLTEEFLELAIAAGIDLSSEVSSKEIYVWGNESQLYRLVSNLIANAIYYTPAEGSINISLVSSEKMGIITVQDTGIGIALDQQERIFERFYRVDEARSRQKGGAGLGLAIAQAIAFKHKGYLTVESELSRGSLFTVRLPMPL